MLTKFLHTASDQDEKAKQWFKEKITPFLNPGSYFKSDEPKEHAMIRIIMLKFPDWPEVQEYQKVVTRIKVSEILDRLWNEDIILNDDREPPGDNEFGLRWMLTGASGLPEELSEQIQEEALKILKENAEISFDALTKILRTSLNSKFKEKILEVWHSKQNSL